MTAPLTVALAGRLGAFDVDVAFIAPPRGVTGVFGPSGCGKTTALRAIAGLVRLTGTLEVEGEVWQDATTFRPAYRRPIGYVFQEASLFPHLSVRRNLVYGAPALGGTVRFDEIVDLLGLAGLLNRAPQNLSGGERQRVAIGRALLSEPKLLLLDEPLSALDHAMREEILPFLERLLANLALPALYVTHDRSEIERLAHHVVLMDKGRVTAVGPLAALQSDPALPLAGRRDAAVVLEGRVETYDDRYGLATLAVAGARLHVPCDRPPDGARRRLRIAAGDVSLARDQLHESTILNIVPARILSAAPAGPHAMVAVVGLGRGGDGDRLLARLTRKSWDNLGLGAGVAVFAQVKSVALDQ